MKRRKIGIMADCFQVDILEGIRKAAKLGADAVQIYVGGRGAVAERWTKDYRDIVRKTLQDNGLVVSAMCGDMGGHGFGIAKDNDWRIEETARMMTLTRELNCDILTTHIGVIPPDSAHPRYAVLQDALSKLALEGAKEGCRVAIETGPEAPETLRGFLATMPNGFVGVNYDPANLVMVLGVDPVAGVETLKGSIFHTHAKDGKMIRYHGPEVVYGFFAEGGIGDLRMEECFLETPLGQGNVDFPAWMAALDAIGYDGYYTIEREVGANPEADIAEAIAFLRKL